MDRKIILKPSSSSVKSLEWRGRLVVETRKIIEKIYRKNKINLSLKFFHLTHSRWRAQKYVETFN